MIENMNRVNFITLAVADLDRTRSYCEALGWVLVWHPAVVGLSRKGRP